MAGGLQEQLLTGCRWVRTIAGLSQRAAEHVVSTTFLATLTRPTCATLATTPLESGHLISSVPVIAVDPSSSESEAAAG